jgi:hypothetical protein
MQREMLYRSVALPPVHQDPFDRAIASAALQRNLRVVTPGKPLEFYRCQVVWWKLRSPRGGHQRTRAHEAPFPKTLTVPQP